MLSVALIFVGITLITNGIFLLRKEDVKTFLPLNIITAAVLIVGNFIELSKATTVLQYTNVTSGFLFGFTYALIAATLYFKLSEKVNGWYSFMVAVYAIAMGIFSLYGGLLNYGILWFAWSILWASTFFENILKINLGKFTPILCIVEGIFAAFIPALLMMFGMF